MLFLSVRPVGNWSARAAAKDATPCQDGSGGRTVHTCLHLASAAVRAASDGDSFSLYGRPILRLR
jgi:hypothetical protein